LRFSLFLLTCVLPATLIFKSHVSLQDSLTEQSSDPTPPEVVHKTPPIRELVEASKSLRAISSNPGDSSVESFAPYYLTGRSWDPSQPFNEQTTFKSIGKSSIEKIPPSEHGWVLPRRLQNATRNHDTVLFESEPSGRQVMVTVLGRWSRSLQWIDLMTGAQSLRQVTGEDPAGNPLNDLNHVYSVMVDSLDDSTKEIWLPCGFHGDQVNKEESNEYARIVDLREMKVKVGPKLPFAGGACVAVAVPVEGPEKPPHICSFGGTQGNHDTGNFLPYTACYDRVRQKWHYPFGKLPYGFDHGSLAHIPAGVCHPSDPARLLIFNYRKSNYGTQASEILAFDLPERWSEAELTRLDAETPGAWYVYANVSYTGPEDEVNAPRDASGMALANNGRNVINFAGTHYQYRTVDDGRGGTRRARTHHRFSTIRSLDVCEKTWSKIGDLGAQTFALQSCASSRLNVAISCGGHVFSKSKY
jgi:hypothetical protein